MNNYYRNHTADTAKNMYYVAVYRKSLLMPVVASQLSYVYTEFLTRLNAKLAVLNEKEIIFILIY